MTIYEYLNRLLGGANSDPSVELYCPLRGDEEQEPIATEETEPDEWLQEDRVAVYECPVCGSRHKFLWGPPAPLYLGDTYGEEPTKLDSYEENGGTA